VRPIADDQRGKTTSGRSGSARNIGKSSVRNKLYMLANTPDEYRWVNPIEDANNWGRRLISVRIDPVADGWEPIPVEWVPATARRIAPDFPQFWSGMLCISKRAVAALARHLDGAGEFLPLLGLNGEYTAWHCLRTVDAIDERATNEKALVKKGISFHRPTLVPVLLTGRVPVDCNVFRVPQSFQKIFVRERFVEVYRSAELTGLDFLPVQ